MAFFERDDHHLHELAERDPEALLRYVRDARDAGFDDTADRALDLLAFSYRRFVRAVVSKNAPKHRVEDLTAAALANARRSIYGDAVPEGANPKQFRGWLASIASNTVADWFRVAKNADGETYDDFLEDQQSSWDVAAEDDKVHTIFLLEIIERHLQELEDRNPPHAAICRLRLDGVPSKDVIEIIRREFGETMTVAAIDQVYSRFRKACRGDAGQE